MRGGASDCGKDEGMATMKPKPKRTRVLISRCAIGAYWVTCRERSFETLMPSSMIEAAGVSKMRPGDEAVEYELILRPVKKGI